MTTNRYPFGLPGTADEPVPAPPHDEPPGPGGDAPGPGSLAAGLPRALLGTIGVLWFVVPPALLGVSIVTGLTFGTPQTPQQQDDSRRALALSAVTLLGLPALGLGLALPGGRRRGAVRFFAAALALGTVALLALAVAGRLLAERQPPRAPGPRPAVCQEYSGGGNECPGG